LYFCLAEGKIMAQITLDSLNRVLVINKGKLTRVQVIDGANQIVANGYAKLNEAEDAYDEQFGVALAFSRAEERYQRKLQKTLIRSL
jgi:hypothetical protein